MKRTSFKNMNTSSSSSVKVDDIVELWKPEKKYGKVRFLGQFQEVNTIWIEKTVKSKGDKKKRKQRFPLQPPDLECRQEILRFYGDNAKSTVYIYLNAIVRSEDPKAEQSGEFLVKGEGHSPVKVVRLTQALARKIQKLEVDLNDNDDLMDAKTGADIAISFDDDAVMSEKYQVQYGGKRTPLSKKERAYALWDLEKLSQPVDRKALIERLVEDGYTGSLIDKETNDVDDIVDDIKADKPKKTGKSKQKGKKKAKKAPF